MLFIYPRLTLEIDFPILSDENFWIPNDKTRGLGTIRCTANHPGSPLVVTLLHLDRLARIMPRYANEDNPFDADIRHTLQVCRGEFSPGAEGGRGECLLGEREFAVDIGPRGIVERFPVVDV
jgi:hypothetical protein